jgi:serine/threonine protein kinase
MLGALGKYRLDQRLGGGGMAEVFLASTMGAEGFSRKVAIKRVLPGYSDNEAFAKMFVSEARISSELVHPNIVSVLDFDRDAEGRLFLVMELVEGKDLDALVSTGLLPFPVVIFAIAEVLRGLGHAHDLPVGNEARGVVHRDISPHNVLLSWAGAVKVSDFGIAKARAASEATASVFIKGKPAYMSPEQANGQPLDGRSDLFAVGIMLWEMLVGRRLFVGEDTRATLAAVLFGQIPRPRSLRGDVPKDLERVTMKLLERELPARYATAEQALHDLLDCTDASKAGREALVAALAERFPGQAPVRQSLLRARSQQPNQRPSIPPNVAVPVGMGTDDTLAATPSLGAVRNAPTATIDHRTGRGRAGKVALVIGATLGAAIATFAIATALKTEKPTTPDPGSASGNAVSSAPPRDTNPPPIDVQAPAPVNDAMIPPDAPSDAKKDAPDVQNTEKRYGSLKVTSNPICTLFVGSSRIGDTPRDVPRLLVGKHRLLLVNEDAGIRKHATVTIRENKTETYHYEHKSP